MSAAGEPDRFRGLDGELAGIVFVRESPGFPIDVANEICESSRRPSPATYRCELRTDEAGHPTCVCVPPPAP